MSAISINLINKIIKSTGRLFHSKQPDVFSGMAFAALASSVIQLETALTVNAWSLRSNSGSMKKKYNSNKNLEYINEFKDKNFHKSLPNDQHMVFFNATPDAILSAKEMFPFYFKKFNFNYTAMFAIFVRLSNYRYYGWVLKNRKRLSLTSNITIHKFHYYLMLNITVSLINKIKILYFLRKKVQSKTPYAWVLNESED